MKGKAMLRILVIAAASTLAACASQGPSSPTGAASANVKALAPAAAAAQPEAEGLSGYKRVTKSGKEYFCRREGVTGSRTQTVETCLTQAQLTALRENGQDFARRVQSNVGEAPAMGPDGSAPMPNAVSY